jgi:hypothetical protein
MNREELWKAGRDETVEVNQRALIDSESEVPGNTSGAQADIYRNLG